MTFVVSGNENSRLREFTGLLFSAFPGITIYEYADAQEAYRCVRTHSIDAVFIDGTWDAAKDFRLLGSIRERNTGLPVYLIVQSDRCGEEALRQGATAYLVSPQSAQDLRGAVLSASSLPQTARQTTAG